MTRVVSYAYIPKRMLDVPPRVSSSTPIGRTSVLVNPRFFLMLDSDYSKALGPSDTVQSMYALMTCMLTFESEFLVSR